MAEGRSCSRKDDVYVDGKDSKIDAQSCIE